VCGKSYADIYHSFNGNSLSLSSLASDLKKVSILQYHRSNHVYRRKTFLMPNNSSSQLLTLEEYRWSPI